jgi:uracil-DNA glycosylase family 4
MSSIDKNHLNALISHLSSHLQLDSILEDRTVPSLRRDLGLVPVIPPQVIVSPEPSTAIPEPITIETSLSQERRETPITSPEPNIKFYTKETNLQKIELLEKVRKSTFACTQCKLCSTRTNVVFGVGNPDAELVFVGEAPGGDEDIQGIPFVGRAGQLLTKMIEEPRVLDMHRDDVFICNVIKCRPPENRNPEPDEIQCCEPYLIQQLEIIQPKVICTLGAYAGQTLLKTTTTISRLRGEWHEYHGIALLPTFHPAYLLRNGSKKKECWEDLLKVKAKLEEFRQKG